MHVAMLDSPWAALFRAENGAKQLLNREHAMEHLFTPWRMEYIAKSKQQGCVLCDLSGVQDDRAALIVCRREHAFMVLNKYPYNNGHFMVVPYRHVASLEDLSSEELAAIMSLVTTGMQALRATVNPDGFNIGANVGSVAGAGVKDHIHMHVVPRWTGDTNFMPLFAETRVIPQLLLDTCDQMREAMARIMPISHGEHP